jgi:DNA-directed RNA polymerase specialized sigma24 family protein
VNAVSTGGFPATRFSIVGRLQADDPDVRARALDAFATAYWAPVSRYIRFKWRFDSERAADLTQEFFARTLESQVLVRFDPTRARFRTYVRLLVDGFVSNTRKAEGRLKRGGGRDTVPLEETLPDGQVRSHEPLVVEDHDEVFYREWVRALFEGAVDDLRADAQAHGRDVPFEVFRRYDLADLRGEHQPTYADLAAALGITVAMVTNHLAAMRRSLRAHVLDRLREVTASDDEFEAEAKRLLGTRR